MKRAMVPTMAIVIVSGSAAFAECKCSVAKVENGWCPDCRKAAGDSGWCDGCGVGYVASRKFTDMSKYEQAVAAHKVLTAAAQNKCEQCATAMVADGKCEH